jgi:hypothetical protein
MPDGAIVLCDGNTGELLVWRDGAISTFADMGGSPWGALTYDPERLSMERSSTAFTAGDRIGQLAVQINDIHDARAMLAQLGWSL